MEINQKITQKEWKDYVENQMYHHGFTPKERAHVNAAFSSDMRDAEHRETAGFFRSCQTRDNFKRVGGRHGYAQR